MRTNPIAVIAGKAETRFQIAITIASLAGRVWPIVAQALLATPELPPSQDSRQVWE
jgi:hypothetical protein